MSLYNIELFKKDFSYVSSYQVASLTYEYDYLAASNNKIQIPSVIAAEKGDYIRITGDSDRLFGIVEKVTDSDTFYTIMYKPFLSIFDTDIYMDRTLLKSVSLEEYFKQAIEKYFVSNSDILQNLNAANITLTSETLKASLDSESNIENLYELVKTALSRYGVCIDADVNVGNKTIDITIGKSDVPQRIIESDLPSIIKKEFTTTSSTKASVNKLYVINAKKESNQLIYYLTKSGTVTKEADESERITPVIFSTVFASASGDETFEDAAYDKALTELNATYENLIELTVLKDDGIVRPDTWNIGDMAKIRKGGREYESILTGKKYSDSTITLIFGSIRLELTKKIAKNEQKKNINEEIGDYTYSKDEIDQKFTGGIVVLSCTNTRDLNVSKIEQNIIEFKIAADQDCKPIFVATIPIKMDMDGNVTMKYYLNGALISTDAVTQYFDRGEHVVTISNNFRMQKGSRATFTVKMSTQSFESDTRQHEAKILSILDYIKNGTYAEKAVSSAAPSIAIPKLGIKAVMFAQGLVASAEWDGTIDISEKFASLDILGMDLAAFTDQSVFTEMPRTDKGIAESFAAFSLPTLQLAGFDDSILVKNEESEV